MVEQMSVQDWVAWRASREQGLREPHGWLSLTALHWLSELPSTYPDLPGRWSASSTGVRIEAAPADGLSLNGVAVDGVLEVSPAEGEAGIRVEFADKVVEIIKRSGQQAIRVRDPQAPTLTGFAGVPTYPHSASWVVEGTFSAYEAPQVTTVGAVVEGLEHQQTALGVIGFTVSGRDYSLIAFEGSGDDLSLLFRDATSGVTTHGGVRSLAVTAPDDNGTVVLDFNRAVNLPCAFTDHGTCPLPPPENVLTLAVEAGERKPR
jgi:hypothetical protein